MPKIWKGFRKRRKDFKRENDKKSDENQENFSSKTKTDDFDQIDLDASFEDYSAHLDESLEAKVKSPF